MNDLEQSITAYSQAVEDLYKAFEERGMRFSIEIHPGMTQEELDDTTETLVWIAVEMRENKDEVSEDD